MVAIKKTIIIIITGVASHLARSKTPRVERGGGWKIMKQIMKLLPVCQVQYCQQCVNCYYVGYNTANNVSNYGGEPVTQSIVNVYQMIEL